jgi:hypothetical protein
MNILNDRRLDMPSPFLQGNHAIIINLDWPIATRFLNP